MKERIKDTLKNIGKALITIAVFVGIVIWLPDSSLFKKIFGYIMGTVTIVASMVFTGMWKLIIKWISSDKNKGWRSKLKEGLVKDELIRQRYIKELQKIDQDSTYFKHKSNKYKQEIEQMAHNTLRRNQLNKITKLFKWKKA